MRRNSPLTVISAYSCWSPENTFAEAHLTKLKSLQCISRGICRLGGQEQGFRKRVWSQLIYLLADYSAGPVSGEVPISQVAGPAVAESALAGSDVIMVPGGAIPWTIGLWPAEIKKAEQLKGGSVAISNFGAASDFVGTLRSDKIGLTPQGCHDLYSGGITDRCAVLVGRVSHCAKSSGSFIGQRKG